MAERILSCDEVLISLDNIETICTGYVDLEKDGRKERRFAVLAYELKGGHWYMWAELNGCELIYRKRMADGTFGIDREEWDEQNRWFKGGMAALSSNLDEVRSELERIQRECPDKDKGGLVLGVAIEPRGDKGSVIHPGEVGIWRRIESGSDVTSIELASGKRIII